MRGGWIDKQRVWDVLVFGEYGLEMSNELCRRYPIPPLISSQYIGGHRRIQNLTNTAWEILAAFAAGAQGRQCGLSGCKHPASWDRWTRRIRRRNIGTTKRGLVNPVPTSTRASGARPTLLPTRTASFKSLSNKCITRASLGSARLCNNLSGW